MKKQKNYCWIGISLMIIIMIVIMIVSGIIYYKMPKQVCHNEFETKKIELMGTINYIGLHDCYYNFNEVEIICEDGIDITIYGGMMARVCNSNEENKICLIKTKKEVCEIVWK